MFQNLLHMLHVKSLLIVFLILNVSISMVYSQNSGTFTDGRDAMTYEWVQVGDQVWMAENLQYKAKESWCYNNKASNCFEYGRLYTWKAASNACPDGWHLPTDKEWSSLEKQIGLDDAVIESQEWRGTKQAEKLKKGGESGFNAVFAGQRGFEGSFYDKDINAYLWTATEFTCLGAYIRVLSINNDQIKRVYDIKDCALSVRCIKD